MSLPSEPYTRHERYLSNIAGQNTAIPEEPYTREERYLDYIAKNGGGGGGTGEGDMKKSVYDSDLAVAGAGGIKAYVSGAIADKVDKVDGKGLSTNDYDDSAKAIVDGVTTALDGKVSKSNTAGLLKNDGSVDTTTTSAVSANTTAISNIKDGTSIDSFSDVETALSGKENTISDLSTIRSGASAGATAYQKPNDGIPKTDLASAVQTSLSKADSAVQDISGKADKVASATNGNFAGLDSNGNLTDSGKKSSDFATAASVTAIEGKIPSGASSSNKMATASDVANCMTWEANAKTGAVNICKLLDGIYSYVLDKTVDYNTGTITITGTPTSTGWSEGVVYNIILPAGTYKARCTSQTGNLNLLLNWDTQGVVTPEGIIFTTDGTKTVKFAWNVTNGTAVDYSAVGVMITTPDYKGDYVPFAMTNKELTNNITILNEYQANSSAYGGNVTELQSDRAYSSIKSGTMFMLVIKHFTSATTFKFRFGMISAYTESNVIKYAWEMLVDDQNYPAVTAIGQTSEGKIKVTFASAVYAVIDIIKISN